MENYLDSSSATRSTRVETDQTAEKFLDDPETLSGDRRMDLVTLLAVGALLWTFGLFWGWVIWG